ncbi:nitrate/nitrite transporter NrtS [Aminobacter ciceronei]|nr:nitrate/nitrite transporter NrtS [Aminobacter ciceronei]
MNEFLSVALRKDIFKRSLSVAVIVGTILNLINQGDAFYGIKSLDLVKCLLTYMVPYCVATYGAVSAIVNTDPARRK